LSKEDTRSRKLQAWLAVLVVVLVLGLAGAVALSSSTAQGSSTSVTATDSSQTSSAPTQQASTSSSVNCSFSVTPTPYPPSTQALEFKGCLTAGASGTYYVDNQNLYYLNGLAMSGTVTSDFPANVQLVLVTGTIAFAENSTTLARFTDLPMLPEQGYTITVQNVGNQDNNVTVDLRFG